MAEGVRAAGLSASPRACPSQAWAAWQAVTLLGSAQGSPPLGGRAHRGWTLEERGKGELQPGRKVCRSSGGQEGAGQAEAPQGCRGRPGSD